MENAASVQIEILSEHAFINDLLTKGSSHKDLSFLCNKNIQ